MSRSQGIRMFGLGVLVLLATVLEAARPAARLHAQQTHVTVAGTVRDAVTNLPVAGARVSAEPTGPEAASDSSGSFRLRLPAGRHFVTAQALGYTAARHVIDAADGLVVTIILQPDPLALPDVDVASRARRDPRLAGFWERRERGLGTFLTREEIERYRATHIVDVFRQMPGFRVERLDAIGEGHVVTLARHAATARGVCPAMVYLDGSEYRMTESGLNEIHADHIEAIEVYSGPARLPPQFARPGRGTNRPGEVNARPQCGVIILWTRAR